MAALLASACTRDRVDAVPVTAATSPPTTQASTTTATEPLADPHGLNRRTAPPYDPVDWYLSHGLLTADEVAIPTRPRANVGDTEIFRVADEFGVAEVEAELVHATGTVAMWVEAGAPLEVSEYEYAATVLTEDILPTLTDVFGPVPSPGVDGDDRIDVLHLTTLGPTAGEFGAADLLPVAIAPESNERELLYISLEATTVGSEYYLATLAHELQHLIDTGQRSNTPLWLAEGLAQLAERMAGYDAIRTDTEFLSTTPVQLNTWGPLQLDGRHYGAAYLFSLYLWERFGDEVATAIATTRYDGMAAVDAALADRGTNVQALFGDWIVANYLDDPQLDPRFGYSSDALRPICPVDRIEALPHAVTGQSDQFAARYHVLEGSGDVTVRFAGAETAGPIPDLPHRGLWMWWSGRSDNSATSLTRSFDLSGLTEASLEFRIWHDTGLGDNALVSASVDQGRTWTALEGRHTSPPTPTFPVPSYTGTSGRGEEPVWVGDRMDLTAYAGGEVMIRFEYITDLFENRAGMALDEIEVPELGFRDGGEEETDWVAEGFTRIPGTLEQPWIVRVVNPADPSVVSDVALEQARGSIPVSLTAGTPAAIVVAPVALATAVPTSYELTVDGGATLVQTGSNVDEFGDPCAGWDLETQGDYALRLDDGRLAIDLMEDQVFTWSAREGYREDSVVTATTQFGDDIGADGAAGMMCRLSNAGYYDVEVAADGYVFAGVAFGDDYEVLHDWTPSDAVQTGDGAVNALSLSCLGDRISLDVNGQTVIDLTDSRLVGGQIALSAASFEQSGFTIWYDDVEITGQDPTSLEQLVSFDDFEGDAGTWTEEENSRGVLEAAGGRYVATVRPADWGVEGYAAVDLSDVVVDLDVTVIENSPDGSITLSCRNQPNGDQYLFAFGLDGFVSISAFINGNLEILSDWDMTGQLSAAVGDINHLQMECSGSNLRLAANGVDIAAAFDDRLAGGDIGVGLLTFEHGNYIVAFDNILIRRAG